MNLPKQSALEHLAAYAVVFLVGLLFARTASSPFDRD